MDDGLASVIPRATRDWGKDPMGERFKNLIDGKWVDSANGSTFDDVSPINKTDVLGSFPRSDHRDVDRAVEAARSHLSAWCRVPARRRSEILWAVAEALHQRGEELATLLTRETGKVLAEARLEIAEAAALLYAMAGEGVYAEDGVAALGQSGPLGVTMRLPQGSWRWSHTGRSRWLRRCGSSRRRSRRVTRWCSSRQRMRR